MANGFIQVPADSTGKKIQTFENTVGANTVEAEAVVLVDNTGANACNVNGSGQLPVAVGNTPSVNQGTSPWLTRQNDGTNTETTLFDVDSSGVTHQFVQGVSLRKSGSGGSVELGTSSNPVRTDPTGTTTQPVSGTVTANQGGTWTVQPGNTANTTAWKVDGSAVTQPVSGTVTANIGTSGSLALDASVTGLQVAQGSTTSGQKGSLAQGAVTASAPTYVTAQTSPLSLTTAGALRTDSSATTQPVSGTVTTSPPSNASTNVTQWAGTAVDVNSGVKSAGTLRVVLATDQPQLTNKLLVTADPITFASAQAVTQSGTWTVQPGNTANTTPWLVQSVPATSGGLGAPFSASQTSTKGVVKASAGTLYGYEIVNNGSALCYIQVFNKLTANVTVGTTAPDWVIPVPAPSSGTAGAGLVHELDKGYSFSTGLVIACTTTRTGSTSATCDVNFFFD